MKHKILNYLQNMKSDLVGRSWGDVGGNGRKMWRDAQVDLLSHLISEIGGMSDSEDVDSLVEPSD